MISLRVSLLSCRLMPPHVICVGGAALHMRSVLWHLYDIELYTLDGKVCMVAQTCLWSNG